MQKFFEDHEDALCDILAQDGLEDLQQYLTDKPELVCDHTCRFGSIFPMNISNVRLNHFRFFFHGFINSSKLQMFIFSWLLLQSLELEMSDQREGSVHCVRIYLILKNIVDLGREANKNDPLLFVHTYFKAVR
jgi:hypothetical protein